MTRRNPTKEERRLRKEAKDAGFDPPPIRRDISHFRTQRDVKSARRPNKSQRAAYKASQQNQPALPAPKDTDDGRNSIIEHSPQRNDQPPTAPNGPQ